MPAVEVIRADAAHASVERVGSAGVPQLLPDQVSAGVIELRRVTSRDAPALVSAIEVSLPELERWFRFAQTPPDVGEQRRRLELQDRAFGAGTDFDFALVETATEELVGELRLNPQAGPRAAGIGYWVRSDRHRRGYASMATRAITAATFEHLTTIEAIEIHMDQANVASVGVPRSLGYHLDREVDRELGATGHTGRGLVWVMTRESWRELNGR